MSCRNSCPAGLPVLQDFLSCRTSSGDNRSTSTSVERSCHAADMLLESGHGIASLLSSEACTGFRSSYGYSTNCACLYSHLVRIDRSPAYLVWWQPPLGRGKTPFCQHFPIRNPKTETQVWWTGFSPVAAPDLHRDQGVARSKTNWTRADENGRAPHDKGVWGACRKLPQWGLGRSTSRQRILRCLTSNKTCFRLIRTYI